MAVTGLAVATLVVLTVALVWGLGRIVQVLSPVLWPLAIAAILACLLDPVVDFIERKGMSRRRAIVTVFAIALLIIAGLFGSIVPQLVNETRQLAEGVPTYASRLSERIEFWMTHPPPWVRKILERQSTSSRQSPLPFTNSAPGFITNTPPANAASPPSAEKGLLGSGFNQETIQTAAGWLAGALRKSGVWLFGHVASWFGILAGLALIPVYAFYFLLEKRGISSRWTN